MEISKRAKEKDFYLILLIYLCFRLLSENKLGEIHNKMFLGLHNLKKLSLYENEISCVMPGSFNSLMNLKTL